MEALARCRSCGQEFYLDVYGEQGLICPGCSSRELDWLWVDWRQFGCG